MQIIRNGVQFEADVDVNAVLYCPKLKTMDIHCRMGTDGEFVWYKNIPVNNLIYGMTSKVGFLAVLRALMAQGLEVMIASRGFHLDVKTADIPDSEVALDVPEE